MISCLCLDTQGKIPYSPARQKGLSHHHLTQIIMLSENIILQSAGSLSVAVLALLMMILQALFFLRKPQLTWYAWSAAISFSALLYSVGIFLEYNTPQGPLNRFSGLLEYTAIICLIHCLYGFTFSYLGIQTKRYHPVAGVCHGLILILLWFTNYIVSEKFAIRDFIGLSAPYIEPALGPLGPLFVFYAVAASVTAMVIWLKHRGADSKHRLSFLVGMGSWILLGIHDGLASMGVPTIQYVMEYGFLGFAIAVLWVVFNSYLEIATEEKYRVITEFANDCILVIQDGKMVFGNPACSNLIGQPVTDSAPSDFLNIMASEDRKTVLEQYNTLLEGCHMPHPQTVRIQRADGQQRFVEIASSLIQYRERPAVLAIMRDMTERKLAEEGLRKAAALETLTTVLENFISDSLGNLLTPIYSRIQMCEMRDSIDDIKSELMDIKRGITELLTGINTFRRFAKSGEDYLGRISSVDIRSILRPLLSGQSLKTYGEEELRIGPHVKLRFVYDPKQEGGLALEELPLVFGSETALKTAIQETLINAVESYDPDIGGEVIVSAKKENHQLILEIADKGRGMSNDDRDKSQLPFFKIPGVKKSARFGLGAYIACESAKYCGGDIRIESTEGVGTKASILLKLSD